MHRRSHLTIWASPTKYITWVNEYSVAHSEFSECRISVATYRWVNEYLFNFMNSCWRSWRCWMSYLWFDLMQLKGLKLNGGGSRSQAQ
ncbi:hypothetical protein ZOSMA_23G00440 [Zostera marina]|uniref:Uncharacterized protein n=1 Tax=Zostera marina TaxID=29655 RepID=A0A0K9PJG8_ZOSMR|nr:hypothetical protein ZOSMA_23G00440 [Zostera marina]